MIFFTGILFIITRKCHSLMWLSELQPCFSAGFWCGTTWFSAHPTWLCPSPPRYFHFHPSFTAPVMRTLVSFLTTWQQGPDKRFCFRLLGKSLVFEQIVYTLENFTILCMKSGWCTYTVQHRVLKLSVDNELTRLLFVWNILDSPNDGVLLT